MRITRHTDYALRLMIFLALRDGERATVRDVADAYGISRHHLMKVAQQLQARGYIQALRGKLGGIELRHRPEDINLGEVVRDMESDLQLVECFGDRNACVITPFCQLKGVLGKALGSFLSVLDAYTLSDLVTGSQRGGLRRQLGMGNPD